MAVFIEIMCRTTIGLIHALSAEGWHESNGAGVGMPGERGAEGSRRERKVIVLYMTLVSDTTNAFSSAKELKFKTSNCDHAVIG